MISLDKFKVKLIEESESVGKFQIGPLPRGYAYTLGNTLRRILLSSIPGAAVTSVAIDGIKHEYTSPEGVQDDIITLVLKLKDLAIKSYTDEPQVIELKVKGKKGEPLVVKASDFMLPSDVEIINGDLEITTLTSNVDFKMQLTVEQGVGYTHADEEKRKEIGVIPIDGIFSPVKRVQLDVTNARFGQYTDLDQINLEIYTNQTVTPSESLLKAAEIFDQMANKLVDLLGGDSSLNEIPHEVEQTLETKEEKIVVSQLNLSTRLTNALLNAGISDLRELKNRGREEVASFRGMGKKSMTELEEIIMDKGISFSADK